MKRVTVTEYLEIDLATDRWHCRRCGYNLISARRNYKEGCLVYPRDPATVYDPQIKGERYSFAPDKSVCIFVEFYCPGCGTLIETEALPPGHPPSYDIEIDIDALKKRVNYGQA